MYRKKWIAWMLLFGFVVLLSDVAGALPWRRRRTYNYYSSGSLQIAPWYDEESSEYRSLDARLDYDAAIGDDAEFNDSIRVHLSVQDEAVLNAKGKIVAEVRLTNLKDADKSVVRYVPVSVKHNTQQGYKPAVFELTNKGEKEPLVEPAQVYRLFVNLHRKSKTYDKSTVLGRIHAPYYVATSGKTRLQRARRKVVMRTFKELYYAKQGWNSGGDYVMDCYAYYMWATGPVTVGAQNNRTILGRLFGGRTPFRSGGDIEEIAKEDAIHADYVRIPGHSFMLLAYDEENGQVWTMEGNFGRSIEIAIRSVGSGWTVGHLQDEHIRPGLFGRNGDMAERADGSAEMSGD